MNLLTQEQYTGLTGKLGRRPTPTDKAKFLRDIKPEAEKDTKEYYHEGELVSKYYAYSLSLFDPDRKIGKRPEHLKCT